MQTVLNEGSGFLQARGIGDANRLRGALLAMERVIKITANHREHGALRSCGFDSAYRVVQKGRRDFVSLMRDHPDVGPQGAEAIFERAEHTSAMAATLLMRHRDAGINLHALPDVSAVPRSSVRSPDDVRKVPDLRTLFGGLDGCACEPGLSVLGPSASFVDLMRFLKARVWSAAATATGARCSRKC